MLDKFRFLRQFKNVFDVGNFSVKNSFQDRCTKRTSALLYGKLMDRILNRCFLFFFFFYFFFYS